MLIQSENNNRCYYHFAKFLWTSKIMDTQTYSPYTYLYKIANVPVGYKRNLSRKWLLTPTTFIIESWNHERLLALVKEHPAKHYYLQLHTEGYKLNERAKLCIRSTYGTSFLLIFLQRITTTIYTW